MPVANVPTPAANRGPFPNLRCSESSLCNQSWSTLLSSKGTLACTRSRFFGGTDFSLCIFPYFFTSLLFYYPSQTLSQLNFTGAPVPYTFNAPLIPTAFGRIKIQFCQADNRPKTRVSRVSLIPKRRFA